MKRGCFFSTVFFLTILSGIIVYLVKFESGELKGYFAKYSVKMALGEVNKKLEHVRQSEGKDSLNVLIDMYKEKMSGKKEYKSEEITKFIEKVGEITKNDTVCVDRLSELDEFLE